QEAVNDKAIHNADVPSGKTVADAARCHAMLTNLAAASGAFAAELASAHAPPEIARRTDTTAAVAYMVRDEADHLAQCFPSGVTSNDGLTTCKAVNPFMTAADELKSDLDHWAR